MKLSRELPEMLVVFSQMKYIRYNDENYEETYK